MQASQIVRPSGVSQLPDTDDGKSFAVRVDDQEWTQVQSLDDAGPDAAVFVVDSTGAVTFGDGTHGRRPSSQSEVTVSYRQGAGAAGNVQVSITTPWPPPEIRYVVSLAADRVGISPSDLVGSVERLAGEKRPRYFTGQLLSAADFELEQQYLIRKRYLHNRALHGSGVVTGLTVTVATSGAAIVVEPGLALDRQGRELELRDTVGLEIGNPDGSCYVIIEYTERETDPVILPGNTPQTVASRVEEGIVIRLSADEAVDDGIALARLVFDSTGWKTDDAFAPAGCR
jgi:hypothetical protein